MPFPLIFEDDLWSFGLGVNSPSKDGISFWTLHPSICLQFSFNFTRWMSVVEHRPCPLPSTGPCFGRHVASILPLNNLSCPSNLSLIFLGSFLCPQGIQNVMLVNIVYNILYYIVVTIIFKPNKKFILTYVGWRSYFRFRISKGW